MVVVESLGWLTESTIMARSTAPSPTSEPLRSWSSKPSFTSLKKIPRSPKTSQTQMPSSTSLSRRSPHTMSSPPRTPASTLGLTGGERRPLQGINSIDSGHNPEADVLLAYEMNGEGFFMQKDYKMFPPLVNWDNINWSTRRPQMDFPVQCVICSLEDVNVVKPGKGRDMYVMVSYLMRILEVYLVLTM
ncbi:uncharacterized protein LOC133716996 [Rosa rugosa]|uniref:uncharacterized protein LOC133716996 n=1 Tax=Rosa rugosa TaxID=74645 RepID=UPI002B416F12|nr:uncharacterized protein LOC133716996 [Rosa rugosa]